MRLGRYKYVRFRAAPDLCFDLEADPLEQRDLLRCGAAPPDRIAELRLLIDRSWDFAAAEARVQVDRAAIRTLPREGRDGNCYHMPDGRVISGDALLYQPRVVTDQPEAFFADWPRRTAAPD